MKDKPIKPLGWDEKDEKISKLSAALRRYSDLLDQQKAIEKLPKNMDFVQLSRSEMRSLSELGAANPVSLQLLMLFGQVMNKQNAVMMSYKAMMDITGKSRSTLDRAIKVLTERNWIQIVKVGQSNVYVLNSAVFWTDSGDKKYRASFTAAVVTTLDEQDKDLRRSKSVELQRVPMLSGKEERVSLTSEQLDPPDQQDLDLN